MREKIFNKGYTVEVVSWENDGDYYATNRQTYPTKEEALAVKHMAETLWDTYYDSKYGVASMTNYDCIEEYYERIHKYFLENDNLLQFCKLSTQDSAENIYDGTLHYKDLLGSSEDYLCRVCDSVKVYYSEEDIYVRVCDD